MHFIVAATIKDEVDGEDNDVFIYDVVALRLCPRGAIYALVFVNMNNERRLICGHRAVGLLAEIAMAGGTVRTVPPNKFRLCCGKKLGEVDEYARMVVARVATCVDVVRGIALGATSPSAMPRMRQQRVHFVLQPVACEPR